MLYLPLLSLFEKLSRGPLVLTCMRSAQERAGVHESQGRAMQMVLRTCFQLPGRFQVGQGKQV